MQVTYERRTIFFKSYYFELLSKERYLLTILGTSIRKGPDLLDVIKKETDPFGITRKQLMVYSRIASVATYHKYIRELDEHGYIRYQPSFSPKQESLVYWSNGAQDEIEAR